MFNYWQSPSVIQSITLHSPTVLPNLNPYKWEGTRQPRQPADTKLVTFALIGTQHRHQITLYRNSLDWGTSLPSFRGSVWCLISDKGKFSEEMLLLVTEILSGHWWRKCYVKGTCVVIISMKNVNVMGCCWRVVLCQVDTVNGNLLLHPVRQGHLTS